MRVSANIEGVMAAVTAAAAVGCSLWLVGGYRRMSGMVGGASNWTGRQVPVGLRRGGNGELIVTGIIRL